MNKLYSILVIGLCIFALYIIWFAPEHLVREKVGLVEVDQTIKSGQIWASEIENPFEEDHYWYVIEIKEGYVKFCKIRYDEENKHWEIPIKNIFTSDKISIFTSVYKKIEQQEHRQ